MLVTQIPDAEPLLTQSLGQFTGLPYADTLRQDASVTNVRWFRFLAPILCVELFLMHVPLANGQTAISANPTTSGEKAAVYGGIAAAAGIVVVITYLVMHKSSITGCTENRGNGLSLRTEGKNRTYALTGDTGQLKVGERVRISGKASKKHDTFAVSRLAKDFGACPTGGT